MRARWRTAAFGATIAATLAALGLASTAASAQAVPATAALTAGTLSATFPTTVAFSANLTGVTQSVTTTQAIDVSDDTGSGAGWNITLTSTLFTSGSKVFASGAVTDTGTSSSCDTVDQCTPATDSSTVYPVVIPSGTTAPAAVKIESAAVNTGLAPQTWTHTFALAVPGNALAGNYTSTWTYTLVSGP